MFRIENVVASAWLAQPLDLTVLSKVLNSNYLPERFPGLIYRDKSFKATLMIFNSGKIVCTGAKSENKAKKAILRLINELKNSGVVILNPVKIEIENIVAVSELNIKLNLEKIAEKLKGAIYEPDQFPALIYKIEDLCIALIFSNGKIIYVGGKKEEFIKKALEKLEELIKSLSRFS
ncbi:MAG: TATA box-binding protein [Candidatus Bathyarchaeia archaeon]|nr:TATA-box-binding protein [Candidatus Bathyarchaeota archaeon]